LINLSFLKDIDFTNTDTLIFLAIFLAIAIIIFAVLLLVVAQIIKIIKRIIIRIFNLDVKKPDMNRGQSVEWLHKQKEGDKEESSFIPKSHATDNLTINSGPVENKKEEKQDVVKSDREKEQQNVLENLDRLKTENNEAQGIEVPTPERFDAKSARVPAKVMTTGIQNPKFKLSESTHEAKLPSQGRAEPFHEDGASGVDFGTSIPELKRNKSETETQDQSMFGGKEEVSRLKLQHEMRYDSKIWKEQKLMGLNFSREEREGLIKKIFPSVYGKNISKKDLGYVLKRMGREWSSATDMNKKATLRKEIKFLKKIGGIK